MTALKRMAVPAAALLVVALAGGADGYALHSQPAEPAPCQVARTSLASGDAARLYVPQQHSMQEFVCTDGTWVHVTGYGN